jgi:2-oxoisovalerate dehydrogenase E1 component
LRFANRALADPVSRLARDPLRKLAPGDRLVGAARLVERHGIRPEGLSWGIAAALAYENCARCGRSACSRTRVYDLLGRTSSRAPRTSTPARRRWRWAPSALRDDDLITSTHRGHGHCHARGLPWPRRGGQAGALQQDDGRAVRPRHRLLPGARRLDAHRRRGEGATWAPPASSAATSPWPPARRWPRRCNGHRPGGALLLRRWRLQHRQLPRVAQHGSALETAGGLRVENNLYGMSVPWEKAAAKLPDIAERACAYGIPGEVVDGMDVLAVREAVRGRRARPPRRRALAHRVQDLPLVRPLPLRPARLPHEGGRGSVAERDPITPLRARGLLEAGLATEEELDASRSGQPRSKRPPSSPLNSPTPPVEELNRTSTRHRQVDPGRHRGASAELRERVPQGGPRHPQDPLLAGHPARPCARRCCATQGLYHGRGCGPLRGRLWRHARPVRGVRAGAGARHAHLRGHHRRRGGGRRHGGMRPVAEIMYVDFTPLAMDQIANQGAKNRYMFGGKTRAHGHPHRGRRRARHRRAPLAEPGGAVGALPGHLRGHALHPYDAKGLLKAAIRDDNPVMFIEHKMLYGVERAGARRGLHHPLGVADVKREGRTSRWSPTRAWSTARWRPPRNWPKEGISVEVIDLRTLKPLDMETSSPR